MRALEAGRFMIRATNNGISAIIAPDGHVVARSAQFVPQVLKGSVIPYAGLTPYARLADYPVIIASLATLFVLWLTSRRASRRSSAS
jgi:apolipoprotein N-acyltransferase